MVPSSLMSTFLEDAAPEPGEGGLRAYLDIVRRRKLIVLAVTALAVAAAAVLSLRAQPVYRAESKIVIGQGGGLVQPGFANSIQPYTATMADLITSNIVAENVTRALNLDLSPHALLAKISTSINPQTAVVAVFVDDHDRNQAVRIDQQVAVVFSQLIADRFGHLSTGQGSAPLTANVFDPAHALPGRVSPKPAQDIVIAFVLGLVLGLVGAFLREHFDRGLRTRDDVEAAYGVPVISQIPFVRLSKDERPLLIDGRGETAEAFRALRANLQYLAVQRPLRTILITSASPEQGKTTVTANLAITLARSGASVVVVDGDLRRPRLEQTFEVGSGVAGLTSVLVGAADLQSVLRDIPVAADPGQEGGRVALVPSGPLPPNPSELLSSAQMTSVLDRLSAQFDYVLIDSPPVLLVADALELARNADGVLIVVRRSRSSTDEARELRTTVARLGLQLLGTVFTDVEPVGSYGAYSDDETPRPPRRRRPFAAEQEPGPAPVREPEPVSSEEV